MISRFRWNGIGLVRLVGIDDGMGNKLGMGTIYI